MKERAKHQMNERAMNERAKNQSRRAMPPVSRLGFRVWKVGGSAFRVWVQGVQKGAHLELCCELFDLVGYLL
jgi:hypothetical protein